MKYDFKYKKIDFQLTSEDLAHALEHRSKMQEWAGPLSSFIGGDALNGVDYDKLQKHFPFYSFRCRDCNYHGSDYEETGELRSKT